MRPTLALAFFHAPPPPPGLVERSWRAGLAPALGPAPPPCQVVELADGEVAVGLAATETAASHGAPGVASDAATRTAAVGHFRFDDPDGLRRALGVPHGAGDAALALAAYAAWGPACAERLDGDFAFAVWDGRARRLFAARDRFGVRPLYYAAVRGRVAVASSPGPVLAALDLPRRPDPWRVAELVAGAPVDPSPSFFSGVLRLPAGDVLLADGDGASTRPYWRPDRERAPLPHSPTEAADAFRTAFDEAVRRRLPSGPVAAALSGGLDSSSIVTTVHSLRGADPPLPTFTAVFPGLPGADERAYSLAVERAGGVAPHVVRPLPGHPVAEREAAALGVDEPLYVPTWPMERAALVAVRDAGLPVYLVGHGGDHVLSAWPEGVFPDLLRGGRWGRLWHEARTLAPPAGAVRLVWDLAVKEALRHAVRPLVPRRALDARRLPPPLLHPDRARELRFAERTADLSPPLRTAVDRHAALLHHPPTHEGLERMAPVSEALGVELRLPFWDRALVDLCLGLRRDVLYRDGEGRRPLRDAMAGRLPDAVRLRRTKATFDPLLNVALRRDALDDIREMAADPGELADWVALPALEAARVRFEAAREAGDDDGSSDAQALLRALTLWLWLRRIREPDR